MTPLQLLDQRIRELIPSLQELSFGCELKGGEGEEYGSLLYDVIVIKENKNGTYNCFCPTSSESFAVNLKTQDYEIIGHPIHLHHVLQAIHHNENTPYIAVDQACNFVKISIDSTCENTGYYWDLTQPLSNQSPECIEFLLSILK